jgi:hypothetical protein
MNTGFIWKRTSLIPGLSMSQWNGLTLHAWKSGEWKVMTDCPADVLAHWEQQTTGEDLEDAQQRAQAAAMVQLQQRNQPLNR